jgi:hypothetical protein
MPYHLTHSGWMIIGNMKGDRPHKLLVLAPASYRKPKEADSIIGSRLFFFVQI